MGGKLHLRLNIGERPIANKYREGKMKRTLKRELKVPEIAKREANEPSHFGGGILSPVCVRTCPCLTRGSCMALLVRIRCLRQVSQSLCFVGENLRQVALRSVIVFV